MVFLKFIKHRGKTRTAVVNQRDNEPCLASSNRARLGNANAPGVKTIDEGLTKRTGVDGLRNSTKCRGNIPADVGDLRDIE
jgi:hypothetical protein